MGRLGAEVIRIDPLKGGIDHYRWPVTAAAPSLYWAGLNKAKRSVALALDKPEGASWRRRSPPRRGQAAGSC